MTPLGQIAYLFAIFAGIVAVAGVVFVAFRGAGIKAAQDASKSTQDSQTALIAALNERLTLQAAELLAANTKLEAQARQIEDLKALALRETKITDVLSKQEAMLTLLSNCLEVLQAIQEAVSK